MEQYERDFCEAVYPEYTDAAIALNNEKTMIMDATDKIQSLQTQLTQSQEENQKLREYAWHKDHCLSRQAMETPPYKGPCTCGLEALLNPPKDEQ